MRVPAPNVCSAVSVFLLSLYIKLFSFWMEETHDAMKWCCQTSTAFWARGKKSTNYKMHFWWRHPRISAFLLQVKRTTLVDSRTSVTDVKFAPKHMGLMLATCSADGVVRIYEAPDVMNLSQWSLQHEISCKLSCSCISWNPSRYVNKTIGVAL